MDFSSLKDNSSNKNDTVEPHNMNGSIDPFFRNYFQFSNILRYNASINLFSYKFCIAHTHTHTFRMKINEMFFRFFFEFLFEVSQKKCMYNKDFSTADVEMDRQPKAHCSPRLAYVLVYLHTNEGRPINFGP